MAVFRVHKTKNFTTMSNHHLQNKNLSLKAKGLLSVILSLPDDWEYSIAGLSSICKEGVSAVKSTIKELEEAGYVVVTKLYPNQTNTGRIEYVYDIHEFPQEHCKQDVENLPLEVQQVDNRMQLKTNTQITNEQKTKDKERVAKPKSRRFEPPTLDEAKTYASEMEYRIDVERFYDHYAANGWVQSSGRPIKDWKAAMRNWNRRESEFHPEKESTGDFSKYDDFMFGKGSQADGDAQ